MYPTFLTILLLSLTSTSLSLEPTSSSACSFTADLKISPASPIGVVEVQYNLDQIKITLNASSVQFSHADIYLAAEPPSVTYSQFPYEYTISPLSTQWEVVIPHPLGLECFNSSSTYLAIHFGGQNLAMEDPTLDPQVTGWMQGDLEFPSSWATYTAFSISCSCYATPSLQDDSSLSEVIEHMKIEEAITGCPLYEGSIRVYYSNSSTGLASHLPIMGGRYYLRAVDDILIFILQTDFTDTLENDIPLFLMKEVSLWAGLDSSVSGSNLPLVAQDGWNEYILDPNAVMMTADGMGNLFGNVGITLVPGEDLLSPECGTTMNAIVEVYLEGNRRFDPGNSYLGFGLGSDPSNRKVIPFTYCCYKNLEEVSVDPSNSDFSSSSSSGSTSDSTDGPTGSTTDGSTGSPTDSTKGSTNSGTGSTTDSPQGSTNSGTGSTTDSTKGSTNSGPGYTTNSKGSTSGTGSTTNSTKGSTDSSTGTTTDPTKGSTDSGTGSTTDPTKGSSGGFIIAGPSSTLNLDHIQCLLPTTFWRYSDLFIQRNILHSGVPEDGGLYWPVPSTSPKICDKSWLSILRENPHNQTWTLLAQQYITTVLNAYLGSGDSTLNPLLENSFSFLDSTCADPSSIDIIPSPSSYTAQALINSLINFNSGRGGIPLCNSSFSPLHDYPIPSQLPTKLPPTLPPYNLPPLLANSEVYFPTCNLESTTSHPPTEDYEKVGCPITSNNTLIRMYQGEILTEPLSIGVLGVSNQNEGDLLVSFLKRSNFDSAAQKHYSISKQFMQRLKVQQVWLWIGQDASTEPVDSNGFMYPTDVTYKWDFPNTDEEDEDGNWKTVAMGVLDGTCGSTLRLFFQIFFVDTDTSAGLIATASYNYTYCCAKDDVVPPELPWPSAKTLVPSNCTNSPFYWKDHHPLATDFYQRVTWGGLSSETYLCNKHWLSILGMVPSSDDLWIILAQQWITAKLNIENGVPRSPITSVILEAGNYLSSCSSDLSEERDYIINMIKALIQYNYAYTQNPAIKKCHFPKSEDQECECFNVEVGSGIVGIWMNEKEASYCLELPPFSTPHNLNFSSLVPSLAVDTIFVSPGGLRSHFPVSVTIGSSSTLYIHLISPTSPALVWLQIELSPATSVDGSIRSLLDRTSLMLAIVFGILAFLILITIIAFLIFHCRRKRREEEYDTEERTKLSAGSAPSSKV